jgi:2-oxoglutarate dehydrogenase C-terminal
MQHISKKRRRTWNPGPRWNPSQHNDEVAEVEFPQPSEAEDMFRATAARIGVFKSFSLTLSPSRKAGGGGITAEVARHPQSREVIWVQEEPDNIGALSFVVPRLRRLFPERKVLGIKRSAAASPATGSAKAHEMEQKTLISLALRDEGK